jgi:hypothetical protein
MNDRGFHASFCQSLAHEMSGSDTAMAARSAYKDNEPDGTPVPPTLNLIKDY